MDLITPARKWAAEPAHHADHAHRMPRLQQVVMFLSVTLPFLGLAGAIWLLWQYGRIGWPEIAVMVVGYALSGFGVTIGFHRLLTHRAFQTYRPIRWVLAILGSAGGQGMVIRWCATHRRHHQMSDREGDPHSPHAHGHGDLRSSLRGFYHAHIRWCFDADRPELQRSIPDLMADRVLLAIDALYFLWVGLGLLIPAIILGMWYGTWAGFVSGLVWGGLLRILLLQHVTWSINSVCHVWGSRPFRSADHSTNNPIFGLLALGEGWHNNHHAFPTSARHGLRWWQFDATWVIIRAMSAVGLAWNVRLPSQGALDAKRLDSTAAVP